MTTLNLLEDSADLTLDFAKLAKLPEGAGVLPCAVQDADSGEVILVAYVNEQALRAAVETRSAVFWSTSRNELWEKGKTSGQTFDLVEVRVNCEQNSLLYRVRPSRASGRSEGGASGRSEVGASGRSGGGASGRATGICHTKNAAGQPRNCYYRRLDFETWKLENTDP